VSIFLVNGIQTNGVHRGIRPVRANAEIRNSHANDFKHAISTVQEDIGKLVWCSALDGTYLD